MGIISSRMILRTCSRSALSSSESLKPPPSFSIGKSPPSKGIPSEHLVVLCATGGEIFAQTVEPQLANPFEIVGAPSAFEIEIDGSDMFDRGGHQRDRTVAQRDAHNAFLLARAKIIADTAQRFEAITPQLLFRARQHIGMFFFDLLREFYRTIEVLYRLHDLRLLHPGLLRRHFEGTHHIGEVEYQRRGFFDRAICFSERLGRLRMTIGRAVG